MNQKKKGYSDLVQQNNDNILSSWKLNFKS